MANQQSSIFYSDPGHCLQIHRLLKLLVHCTVARWQSSLQGKACDAKVDGHAKGEVEENRVWRCNLAVGILMYSSKNYCIFCGIFMFWWDISIQMLDHIF